MKGTWVWIYAQTLPLIWWRKMKPVPSTPAGRAGDFEKEISLFVVSLCVAGFEMKVWVHSVPTEDELLPSGMSWERRAVINKKRKHSRAKVPCEDRHIPALSPGWGPPDAPSVWGRCPESRPPATPACVSLSGWDPPVWLLKPEFCRSPTNAASHF